MARHLRTTHNAAWSSIRRVRSRHQAEAPARATPATSTKPPSASGTSCTRARREVCAGAFNTLTSPRTAGPEAIPTRRNLSPRAFHQRLLTTWFGPLSATTFLSCECSGVSVRPWDGKKAAPYGAAFFITLKRDSNFQQRKLRGEKG